MSVRRSAGGVWIEKRKKKDMSLILCIETGTDICSVGLARDGELISLRESDQGRDHARQVGVFVDELLSQTGIAPEELDAVAVGKGPGSYTGLRIGVSFAKGLCYGLRIPLVAIGSLDALTEVAKEDYDAGILSVDRWEEACLCPMVDAHGGLYPGIRCCGNSSFGRIRRGRYGGEFRGMARRRTSFRDFRKRCGQMCRIAARCDADPGGAFCPRACAAGTGGARCGPHGGYRVLRAFLPEGFRRHPVEKEVILNYRRECVPGCVE